MFERMPWDEYRDTGEPDEREQLACKDDGAEVCSCPESLALRAELATVTAERDYLRGMASPDDLRLMRQELARGWLPESEQTDFDKVPG